MANKVYDYSLYTGKDLSLNYGNFTSEALSAFGQIPSEDIVFEGDRTFVGIGGKVSSDFRIIINNLDSTCGLLKAKDNYGNNIHPEKQSDNQIILTFPQCVVVEVSLGEITVHKVYNSYQGFNQDTQTQESYGPGGCKLATKLPAEATKANITNESPSAELKQYSIPCFYVDDQSINGYGHYRKIQNANEELQVQEGYQTLEKLMPFDSQRVRQMLFLSKQLFTKDMYHVLLNEGTTPITNSMSSFPLHTVTVQNNIVYINNKEVYHLQPGDKLIKYEMTPIDSKDLVADPGVRYGFSAANIDDAIITYLGPAQYYSFNTMDGDGSEGSFINPIYSLVADIGDFQTNEVCLLPNNKDSELKYHYTGKLANVQYTLLWGNTLTTDEDNGLQQSVQYTKAQGTCKYFSQDQSKQLVELINSGSARMSSGVEMQIIVDIDNVPYFGLDGVQTYQSNIEQTLQGSDGITPDPVTLQDWTNNRTKILHYKRVRLQDSLNIGRYPGPGCFGNNIPLIATGYLAHYDRLSYEEVLDVQCDSGVSILPWPVYEQINPLSLVVVGHFQTLPDKVTEGIGNNDSMSN